VLIWAGRFFHIVPADISDGHTAWANNNLLA
jgi:hypothetical protein